MDARAFVGIGRHCSRWSALAVVAALGCGARPVVDLTVVVVDSECGPVEPISAVKIAAVGFRLREEIVLAATGGDRQLRASLVFPDGTTRATIQATAYAHGDQAVASAAGDFAVPDGDAVLILRVGSCAPPDMRAPDGHDLAMPRDLAVPADLTDLAMPRDLAVPPDLTDLTTPRDFALPSDLLQLPCSNEGVKGGRSPEDPGCNCVALCPAAWADPGVLNKQPACGRRPGPTGTLNNTPCTAQDNCGPGWHICSDQDAYRAGIDVSACKRLAKVALASPSPSFWAADQLGGSNLRESVFVCGSTDDPFRRYQVLGVGVGKIDGACQSLCKGLDNSTPPWKAATLGTPALGLIKESLDHGGVMCCRDVSPDGGCRCPDGGS